MIIARETALYKEDAILDDMTGMKEEYTEGIGDALELANAAPNIFYAYSTAEDGTNMTFTNSSLQYRGVATTMESTAPEDPESYTWGINPSWAMMYADAYLQDVAGGFHITHKDLGEGTYANLSAVALAFYLAGVEQARFGFDPMNESYGAVAPSFIAYGSGAGVRWNNGGTGRFIAEVRDNSHWSLKRY